MIPHLLVFWTGLPLDYSGGVGILPTALPFGCRLYKPGYLEHFPRADHGKHCGSNNNK